jgi:hypothetical protein
MACRVSISTEGERRAGKEASRDLHLTKGGSDSRSNDFVSWQGDWGRGEGRSEIERRSEDASKRRHG